MPMTPKESITLTTSLAGAIGISLVHEISEGDWATAIANVAPLMGVIYALISIAYRTTNGKDTAP